MIRVVISAVASIGVGFGTHSQHASRNDLIVIGISGASEEISIFAQLDVAICDFKFESD